MPARPSRLPLPPPPAELATPLLGELSPAQFMRRYWHRKPLLIRQAVPGMQPPLGRDALFDLAARDEVEARLIRRARGRWQFDQGPFEPGSLPSLRTRQWTLLVQGVNLYDDAAHELLNRFRFVADARLDDLMISYATDGGGVGPHFDSYDVFLLQAQGRRRWRISAQKDLTLAPGLPLKVLQNFTPEHEWVLEPGDMLYLPPHLAHDGVAEGECITCSIGFRAPQAGELTSQFLNYLADQAGAGPAAERRYADAGQPPATAPARLPEHLVAEAGAILAKIKWSGREVSDFLGRYLSEPKANVFFDPPRQVSDAVFCANAAKRGIKLDRRSILLYDDASYYMNGEPGRLAGGARKLLMQLADAKGLQAQNFVTLTHHSSMTALLCEWYRAGWIQVA